MEFVFEEKIMADPSKTELPGMAMSATVGVDEFRTSFFKLSFSSLLLSSCLLVVHVL